MSEERSAADLIAILRARGLTQSEIAAELGRSPRMVRAVARGDKPGRVYVDALAQLVDRGRVSRPPARRRSADGNLVKVRAPRGEVVAPKEAPRRARGKFSRSTTYLAEQGRLHEVQGPLKGRLGRARARDALIEIARNIAKGQAHGTRRIHFNVVLDNGQTVPIGEKGGYRASTILRKWHEFDDDPMEWVTSEIAHRYKAVADGEDGTGIITIQIIDPGGRPD